MTLYGKLQKVNLKIRLENLVHSLLKTKIKEKLNNEDFRHEGIIVRLEQARIDNQLEPYIKSKKDKHKAISPNRDN